MLNKQREIISPLAQGWQLNVEDAQPVIQVRPELPLCRPSLQITMRGGDQPHVGANRLVAPNSLESLVLEDPEDLGLKGKRHIADLVEKQRPAVALLELADATAVGAGEGALLMAKKLAFQQVLRDGRTVEREEGRLGPGTMLVDGAGNQFLAGPALASDQHGDILGCDAADRLVHLTHDGGAAQDVAIRG